MQARIDELKAERIQREAALAALPPQVAENHVGLAECLGALPDLREALQEASPKGKRAAYSAFDLRVVVDRCAGAATISAMVDQAIVRACKDGSVLGPILDRQSPNNRGRGWARPMAQSRMIETLAF